MNLQLSSMAIHVICPNGYQLHVADKYSGKRAHCPKWRATLVIPRLGDSGSEIAHRPAEEHDPATVPSPSVKPRKPDTRRKKIRGHIVRGGKALLASSHVNAWACPDRVELQSYAIGKLPISVLEMVAGPLLTCPECDGVVESLDGATDEFLEALRHAYRRINPFEEEPDLERALAAIRASYFKR